MSEKENLTPFQIQLLLYYLTAEPSKRTVTDSARSLNVSKWVVTRTLDTLEKLNIVERLENRKTVLTVPGVKLAEKYQKQRKVLEKYELSQLTPLHKKPTYEELIHTIEEAWENLEPSAKKFDYKKLPKVN